MTKPRLPLTVEHALQRIAVQLPGGVEAMAEAVGCQPGTIRAWMDPDRPEQAPFDSAIALDLAFQAEGGEGAPLFEVYAATFQMAGARRFADRRRLLDFTQSIALEAGEAVAALVAASRDGATEQDRQLVEREVDEAIQKLLDVRPLIQREAFHGTHSIAAQDPAPTTAQPP